MKRFKVIVLLISITLLLAAVGCGDDEDGEAVAEGDWTGQTYKLAIFPFMDKDLSLAEWQPIADYLSEATGATFELVVADNTAAHIALVNNGKVDFATQNPLGTAKVLGNTTVLVKHVKRTHLGGTYDKMRAVFISRREEAGKPALVPTIWEIPGHRVAAIAFNDKGASLSPMMRLREEGIDLSEVEFIETGSIEDVVRAVYNGEAEAGFIPEFGWGCIDDELENPDLIADIGKGAWVPNWGVVAQNDLPADFVEVVKAALLDLTSNSEALAACVGVEMFVEADNSEYAPFKDFE